MNEEIKSIYTQLNQLRGTDNCYKKFVGLINEILVQIDILKVKASDEIEKIYYENVSDAIGHTLGKEVGYIKQCQDSMRKKNAPQIRTIEYNQSVSEAVGQIHRDLSTLIV